MCGITGMITLKEHNIKEDLLKTLQRLEYRGYDSVGYATNNCNYKKSTKSIQEFIDSTDKDLTSSVSISHSRWATHGGVTETNAHPHFSKDKKIFAVHNGIIENYEELKKILTAKGYEFITQTDTEIIPHYFHNKLFNENRNFNNAVIDFLDEAKGTFAILLTIKDDDKLYAIKKDSPLVLGLTDDGFILSSDIYSFSNKTNKAIFFDDNEFAIITKKGYEFFNKDNEIIKKEIKIFDWKVQDEKEGEFPHYMIKEIYEQPVTTKRLIDSLQTIQKDNLKRFKELIQEASRVVFIASGTSYHASLIGVHLLNRCGIESHAVISSEFENFYLVDDKTLLIAVSQSGETMDVVTVIKKAKLEGAKVASIVNVPYSTIQRHSDTNLEILAGQEICVAATKTFTNQLVALFAIAKEFGYSEDLTVISEKIEKTIKDNKDIIKDIAKKLYQKNDIFVLGKGATYPIAREIALKFKEIDYIHAEGMMAGELKHGTIALIEDGTPVISLVPDNNLDVLSNSKEVEARGAKAIIISNNKDINPDILVPKSDDTIFSIYSTLVGHLLSYEIGVLKKVSIDKPRNLAKSVTVH